MPPRLDVTSSDKTGICLERPRSFQSSFPDLIVPGWAARPLTAELDGSYSPPYSISTQTQQLPSVHTLLGPLPLRAALDRPQYSNGSDSAVTANTLSSAASIPSPISVSTAEVEETRYHSVDLSPQMTYGRLEQHDGLAVSIGPVVAVDEGTPTQLSPGQHTTSNRHRSTLSLCHSYHVVRR